MMDKNRRTKINEKLELLRGYVGVLEKMRPLQKETLLDDDIVRGAAERYLHLAAEAVIDVANQIIAEFRFRTPDDYQDTIQILGEEGVLDKSFADEFAPVASFRNILVHDYAKLDYDEIVDKINNRLGDFEKFATQVAQHFT